MTKEKKQVLLKDLCDRLPYVVLLNVTSRYANKQQSAYTMVGIVESDVLIETEYDSSMGMMDARPLHIPIKDVKPYLRTMSSMTEKEKNEYDGLLYGVSDFTQNANNLSPIDSLTAWLNAHHFDYRDLIGMGLALEAPDGMYKN